MTFFRHGKHARRSKLRFAALPAVGALALAPVLIHPGDTMSGIAAAHGLPLAAVEQANPQVTNPNLIYAGQSLNLPGRPASESGGGGLPVTVHAAAAPAVTSSSDLADVPGVPRAFAACVALRESGNNPRAVNSIPGWIGNGGGAYGFIDSTWAGLGYSGQPFDAPVSVQKQAFSRLYATNGKQPWSPSDGCL